jgi:disulfide oxidoreductase YuzD
VTDRGVNASGRVGDLLQHLDQLGIEPQEVNVSTLSQLAADSFRKEYITIKGVPYLRSSPEEQKKTDKEIAERIENADLSEPIIVVTDDGEPFAVADGNHRLQKAVINNEPAVLVRYVTKEQLPG